MVEAGLTYAALALALTGAGGFLFWRHVWFWRNPPRRVPPGENIVAAADGTIVYVKRAAPGEPVIVCKQGVAVSVNEIVREELGRPKILIGTFMSPFDVHHNRAPIAGVVAFTRQHPARGQNHHMGSMHWRSILGREPIYARSPHIVENNRAVTRIEGLFRGESIACYVVQIAGRSVHGIDVDVPPGEAVAKGERFGMIRVGSQVDVIVPVRVGMRVRVAPGQRVRAGETVLID